MALAAGALALGLAACSGYAVLEPDPGTSPEPGAVVTTELSDGAIGGVDAASYAFETSETFFDSAALVVLAANNDAALVRAGSLAVTLGVPALVAPDDPKANATLIAELERLDTRTVLVVGDVEVPDVSEDRPMLRAVPAPIDSVALRVVIGHDIQGEQVVAASGAVAALASELYAPEWLIRLAEGPGEEPEEDPDPGDLAALPGLPSYEATVRVTGALVVTGEDLALAPAVGTARAAGADVLVLDGDSAPTITQAEGMSAEVVLSLGPQAASLGTPETVAYLARVAVAGVELPGGGLTLLPGKAYLALRGLPGVPELGPVGEGVAPAVQRLVNEGRDLPSAVPTLELVTTVVTEDPGPDGSYSARQSLETLRAAVTDAQAEGAMVLLSFQPGRELFVDQIRAYSELLAEPNVGVLLEPQWRLDQSEVPSDHSGAIGDDEIVATAQWLADFTRESSLPPKMLAVRSPLGPSAFGFTRAEVEIVVLVNGAAVAPEVPTPPGADPVAQPPIPAVTAEQVWSDAVVDGPRWWGWEQGANPVPLEELLDLSPEPVLITLS